MAVSEIKYKPSGKDTYIHSTGLRQSREVTDMVGGSESHDSWIGEE
jgi:hypothetical protein